MSESHDIDDNDVFKILVATDNHLGYNEKDTIRGDDSFRAFEEILEIADAQNVDFILLGGDLFHEAAPSQNTLNKCLKLLRRYTLGDKQISIEFLSDQSVNFHEALNQTVNYEDPNLNVSIPVFSIHGNHDDPSGYGRLSSLDLLSTSGLINYFGRWTDLTKVEISPILLKKGNSQIALYGLSHIPDVRLARLFQNGKVIIEKPDPQTGEWFNLMVLHQNRADRGPKNYLPEEILPNFLDLIIWGHEHDCRIIPEENYSQNFYVSQPGSSVATSLAEGEAKQKHIAILLVHKKTFKLEPIALKTIRPFVFESLTLSELIEEYRLDEGDASNKVAQIARNKIESMIQKANELLTDHPRQPKLPLIRLRILYDSEDQMFNAIRFGQQYNEKVANPSDMILFKKMIKRSKHDGKANEFDKNAMNDAFDQTNSGSETRVEEIVDKYFEQVEDSKKLKLFPSKILSEMCFRLVARSDVTAADDILKFFKEKAIENLMKELPNEESVGDVLSSFQANATRTHEDILRLIDAGNSIKVPKDESRDEKNSIFSTDSSTSNVNGSSSRSKKADKPRATTAGAKKSASSTANTTATVARTGGGRGSRTRGGGNSHVKPELDVSITSHQPSLLSMIGQRNASQRRANRAPVYEISEWSE